MLPPAPGRFSTTTGVAKSACMRCCKMRASRSAEPPAANGTTMVIGRCGQSCACAGANAANASRPAMPPAKARRSKPSNRLEMRIAALEEILVGVAHGLRLGAADHDLKIHRLQAVVLISMNHAGRTGD